MDVSSKGPELDTQRRWDELDLKSLGLRPLLLLPRKTQVRLELGLILVISYLESKWVYISGESEEPQLAKKKGPNHEGQDGLW
jgi:hypothetical protein